MWVTKTMGRLVLLVDAGYLFSQAIQVLSSKASRSRTELKLNDASGLIKMLVSKASAELANPNLLRVYWYDGIKGTLSADHKAIVNVDDVQLRSGTINGQGQQKGVDSKIVIDLIELATNQAISDAMIVTGDGDLAIGIELSQRRGIRVAVLGVEDLTLGVHHAQSSEVTNVADRVVRIGASDLSNFLSYQPKSPASIAVSPVSVESQSTATGGSVVVPNVSQISTAPETPIESAVRNFLQITTPSISPSVIGSTGSIDSQVDRALLFHVYTALGGRVALSGPQKRDARAALRKLLRPTSN